MTRKRPKKAEPPKDFPKKKQKVGKGKRTPENATVISFKSQSVVVPIQLEKSNEPTTHRKLGLQTLLGQVGHYKPTVRKEALIGIRELLETHQQLIAPNFSKILHRVTSVLADESAQVRLAFCTILKYLFNKSSVENVRPFMPVLSAHLVCGFTHILEEIQFDSLKVFEILLAHFPTLLVPHAYELLPLLVRLISRQKQLAETKASTSSGGRKGLLGAILKSFSSRDEGSGGSTLASNPHSRLAVQESRCKIFSLISSFLETLFDSPSLSCEAEKKHQLSPVVDVENRRVLVPEEGTLAETDSALCNFAPLIPHVVVLKHHGVLPSEGAFLPQPTNGRGSIHDGRLFPDNQQFVDFVQSLLLLLLESWVECCPAEVFNIEASIRPKGSKNQALPFMETVLSTMCLLLKLVHKCDRKQQVEQTSTESADCSMMHQLRKKYSSELKTHLITHFPFSSSIVDTPTLTNHSAQVLSMDFVLCYILLLLHRCPDHRAPTDTPLNSSVADLICSFFLQLQTKGMMRDIPLTSNAIPTFVAILPLFIQLCQASDLPDERLVDVLKCIWTLYSSCHPLSSNKQLLVACFNEQLKETFEQQRDRIRSLVFSELLFPWIQDLPDLLISLGDSSPKTSSIIISSISLVATRVNSPSMTEVLESAVDSVFSVKSVLDQLPTAVQRKAVELLWHLPLSLLTQELLSKLSLCVNSGKCDGSTSSYLVQVVHHRFCGQPLVSLQLSASLYLSFMLSVIVGYSTTDLQRMQPEQPSEQQSTIVIDQPREGLDSSARIKVVECACSHIQSSPLSSVALKLLENVLLSILSPPQTLPFDAAFGVLKLCNCCLTSSSDPVVPDGLVSCFGQLCLSTLVAMEELHPQLSHPLASSVHPLLPVSSTEIEKLLRASDSVLKHLFVEFQKKTTAFDVEKIITVFIRLLKVPSMASCLRQQREEVLTTALQFSSITSHKSELDVAISKFRY